MNADEIVELTLIPVLGTGFWWIAAKLPDHIELGRLLLGASALLLFQSLIRDLWLLAKARRNPQQASSPRVARCMCVESMVGITGIVIGLTLFGWSIGKPVPMGRWSWSIVAMLVMAAGFLMKDYVLETKPWRLRRDPNHLNIIVKWKR